MPDIAPRVGRVIRRFREDRGYSQERLAETAGLHRTYISLVERGQRNISVDALNQIAEALDVYASRLLAEAEKEPEVSSNPPTRRRRGRT